MPLNGLSVICHHQHEILYKCCLMSREIVKVALQEGENISWGWKAESYILPESMTKFVVLWTKYSFTRTFCRHEYRQNAISSRFSLADRWCTWHWVVMGCYGWQHLLTSGCRNVLHSIKITPWEAHYFVNCCKKCPAAISVFRLYCMAKCIRVPKVGPRIQVADYVSCLKKVPLNFWGQVSYQCLVEL